MMSSKRSAVSSSRISATNNTAGVNREVPEKIKPGDILDIQRLGYRHFAVYIGKGIVIHRLIDDNGTIEENTFWGVVMQSSCETNTFDCILRHYRSRYTIVKRAKSKLGPSKYNLVTSNCEHFANWCRYNTETSFQVNKYIIWERLFKQNNIIDDIKEVNADKKLHLDDLMYHFRYFDNKKAGEKLKLLKEIVYISSVLKGRLNSKKQDDVPKDIALLTLAKKLNKFPDDHVNIVRKMKDIVDLLNSEDNASHIVQEIIIMSIDIDMKYGDDVRLIKEFKKLQHKPKEHEQIVKNILTLSKRLKLSLDTKRLVKEIETMSMDIEDRWKDWGLTTSIITATTNFFTEQNESLNLERTFDEDLEALHNLASKFPVITAMLQLNNLAEKLLKSKVNDAKNEMWKLEEHSLVDMTDRDCIRIVEAIHRLSRVMQYALQ